MFGRNNASRPLGAGVGLLTKPVIAAKRSLGERRPVPWYKWNIFSAGHRQKESRGKPIAAGDGATRQGRFGERGIVFPHRQAVNQLWGAGCGFGRIENVAK